MRILRFVPVFLFLLLLGGPVLLSEKAYAACCGCSTCKLMIGCSCPGQNGCAWYKCRTTDSFMFQTYAPIDGGAMDLKVTRNLDVPDMLVYLRQGGECARRSTTLRLLGNTVQDLQVEPTGFDYNNQYDSTLALQVAASAER